MTESDALKHDFEKFRDAVTHNISDMTAVMRDQVRMDALMQSQAELVKRMAEVVDDLQKRVHTLETSMAVSNASVSRWDRIIERVLLGVISAALGATVGLKL